MEVLDPQRVRFVLKQPWPDFMTFYATPATGAAWIVPKKYVEKVGEDGFKKAPVGAGPYKFVAFKPGRGAVAGGLRRLLAQGARGEDPRLPRHPRRVHPAGRAQARRGRHRVLHHGAAGGGGQAHAGSHAGAHRTSRSPLAALHRAVGSEVALARPARAARRQPRHRSRRHQPGASTSGSPSSPHSFIPQGMDYLLGAAAVPVRRQARPSSSWPRPATPMASTRATSPATPSTAWPSGSRW